MNKASKEFGKGNYSFTGPQDSENKEPETITKFPTVGKAKAFPSSEKHDYKVEFIHEVTTVDKFYHISVEKIPKIHTLKRLESAKPKKFYVKKRN